MKRNVFALAIVVLLGCSPPPTVPTTEGEGAVEKIQSALATSMTNPYGATTPVVLYLGVIAGDNRNWALYQRRSDNNCTWFLLSNDLYIPGPVSASMSSGNDRAVLPADGQSFGITCSNWVGFSWSVGAPKQTVNSSIDIWGGDGDDEILCTGDDVHGVNFPARCFGEGGNDRMWTWAKNVWMDGGAGNDTLFAFTSSPNVALSGSDGDDCISAVGQTFLYSGGNGYDRSATWQCATCEAAVYGCP